MKKTFFFIFTMTKHCKLLITLEVRPDRAEQLIKDGKQDLGFKVQLCYKYRLMFWTRVCSSRAKGGCGTKYSISPKSNLIQALCCPLPPVWAKVTLLCAVNKIQIMST